MATNVWRAYAPGCATVNQCFQLDPAVVVSHLVQLVGPFIGAFCILYEPKVLRLLLSSASSGTGGRLRFATRSQGRPVLGAECACRT